MPSRPSSPPRRVAGKPTPASKAGGQATSKATGAVAGGAPAARAHGRFITFEGGEGAGKSTQLRRLAEKLAERGVDVVTTREPGGSPGAEIIRHVLLSGAAKPFGAFAEAALFAAARADHLAVTIRPALERGAWVICDRFADSTRAYQGAAGHIEPALLDALEAATVGDTRPDLTLLLDIPAEEGLARAAARSGVGADRFESEGLTFHRQLRDAFLAIAAREPGRCVVIDGRKEPDIVTKAIWQAVSKRLSLPRARRRSVRA
ncbi:dTMP kinase [Angulomicrobium tetraedrale]|uniref:Thymidylate kinase n=1 Tax=Ancylobacter tetraedralis TaxID=217068 RepID=A0A839Z8N5_9HYPH|nr:dTMP kinase [Ancylobacter tetraedralis]MBB3771320.1 dTMP kinase [Ancylobacter tetraedralis]